MRAKNHWRLILICITFSILLYQEFNLSQVLCHKNNGSIDLEFAIGKADCSCKCPHSSHPEPQNHEFCGIDCIDTPISGNIFLRIQGPQPNFKFGWKSADLREITPSSSITNLYGILRLLPFIRYLPSSLSQIEKIYLIC